MKNFRLALIFIATALVSAQTPEQKILTYKEYASIVHKSPYTFALKMCSAQQVKVFYALRQVSDSPVATGSTSLDDRIKDWLSDYLPDHGFKNQPNTIEEFAATCKTLFPDLIDWHRVSEDWFDPTQSGHYANELANDTGVFRDKHIFRVLVDRTRRGDRVFAVIGSSHVVVQEPALKQEFGKPGLKLNGLP